MLGDWRIDVNKLGPVQLKLVTIDVDGAGPVNSIVLFSQTGLLEIITGAEGIG